MLVRLSRLEESILLESFVAVALYPDFKWNISPDVAGKSVPYSISASLILFDPVVSVSTFVTWYRDGSVTV